jgi:hypothetical protein
LRFDVELARFQISQQGMHMESFRRALTQYVQCHVRGIHGCHVPAVGCEIQRVPPQAARQVERPARSSTLNCAYQQGLWRPVGGFPSGVTFVPVAWHRVK